MENLRGRDDTEISAICDIDEDAAQQAAEPYGASVYTDHELLYETETDLDAVFIVLPPFAHADQEILAAEHGIDLFVDKPLALSNETARQINNAIEANDVISSTGYQLRYADAVRTMFELLDGRTLGLVQGYYKSGVPTGPGHWWRNYEQSGGQIVEQATHIYDLVRQIGGEVESVSAVGGHNVVEGIDFEDVVSANLVHKGGVVGHVASTSASPRHTSGVEVIGEDLKLNLSGNTLTGVIDGEEIEYQGEDDPSRKAVESFVEAVKTRDTSGILADYSDAMRSLALTLAVEESLDTGEPVEP